MNNQEVTKEDLIKENHFLKIKLNKTLEALANQQHYTIDLETDLHIAHDALRALNETEQEQAQG
ncbi:hypothetical protein K0O13_07690 [Mammaliicoccus sciuri]|uniref:hypothetical protein n=1 Tax=Mammaliicoccus sciuri TaxID=1296 RepID=UPI001C62E81F|nr:hypothetical protein [Mammaliicoccus sciuri]QYG29982.1 hypothetical protein K0O13_07690 [Mammaliicoccus sciuri]